MKKTKEIIISTLISGLIGMIIYSVYMLMLLSKYIGAKKIIIDLFISFFIGIIIANTAKFIFKLISMNIIKNIKMAYLIETLVVITMTAIASYFMGEQNINNLIFGSLIAAVFSSIITLKKGSNSKKLNNKLKKFQSNK